MKLIPVFYIQEDKFIRYELLVNHEIISKLDLPKINKFFTFKKNATTEFFYCLYP